VLVTDDAAPTRPAMIVAAREQGVPEIFVPRAITRVTTLPLLGSGKLDYVEIAQLVAQPEPVS
jgi:acyl-[acyl-carrier-protein]-phospholipid O-acyltransferase / long-chain-fatty-acid--[acyl-carrier-protein] ligase